MYLKLVNTSLLILYNYNNILIYEDINSIMLETVVKLKKEVASYKNF